MATVGIRLLLMVVLATAVAAADDAEFAFNLLSDVAPILALFGDQFAKQFMSESLTWDDHLLFAMVPLGIVTAITAAVRVQGTQVAKAFIGRARENRALAEIEIMSSTSNEVCELFNGHSIVRAMGKPKIWQFLIFPEIYNDLEICGDSPGDRQKSENEGAGDKTLQQARSQDAKSQDKTCGIHSLESATKTLREARKPTLLECKPYHSLSVSIMESLWSWALALAFLGCPWTGKPRDEEGQQHAAIDTCEPKAALSGPPNLQLNLSSDHYDERTLRKRHEIFLAAFAAVLLQTGLIVIAAITAYHVGPQNSSTLFESKSYGFPCYAAGSILLSLGTGLCSLIVEHSTVEHSWEAVDPNTKTGTTEAQGDRKTSKIDKTYAPRLIWLQQEQTVNDQSFKSYAILAGAKHRVTTSRRDDDVKNGEQSTESDHNSSHAGGAKKPEEYGGWLTAVAALLAGFGFIAQFMGLRGLAFPCSIAQLGAIFIMALIRAGIRRRLGRVPEHYPAFDGYELDYLAALIVLYPNIRAFSQRGSGKENIETDTSPSKVCRWRVSTKDTRKDHVDSSESASKGSKRETPPAHIPSNHESEPEPKLKEPSSESKLKILSSQQLICVRQRLGDLSRCKSKSSGSALSLVQSIEYFMDNFLPRPHEDMKSFKWFIEATKLNSTEGLDQVWISVSWESEKWKADIGIIDAILSLWMASIEAERSKNSEDAKENEDAGKGSKEPKPDWRRTEAGDRLSHRFRRILGPDSANGALKRDISWWVDSFIAEQSYHMESNISDNKDGDKVGSRQDGDKTGSREDGDKTESRQDGARNVNADLVIGFNGNLVKADAPELSIISKASLPTILAQHLFTSFMWQVVKELSPNCLSPGVDDTQRDVEIDGLQTFNSYDFDRAWLRPRLSHRKLTKAVRQMESYGLGNTTDILLCMIPALSFQTLLPNREILKLMPRVSADREWVETASCYNKLLETIKTEKVVENNSLNVAIVVASMDFLALAYEPYDKFTKPPTELNDELERIVEKLVQPGFTIVMEKLAPIYDIQHRRSTFEKIFTNLRCFEVPEHSERSLGLLKDDIKFDKHFATHTLHFTQHHMNSINHPESFLRKSDKDEKGAEARDIFGWTPYHYCFVSPGLDSDLDHDSFFRNRYLSAGDDDDWMDFLLSRYNFSPSRSLTDLVSTPMAKRLLQLTDNFGRSPVQIAALAGRHDSVWAIFFQLNHEERRRATHSCGIDGMTLLHLVSRSGNAACLTAVTKESNTELPFARKDFCGRQALHIASYLGHDGITRRLLKMGSRSDQADDTGKFPFDHFVEKKRSQEKKSLRRENDHAPKSDDAAGDRPDSSSGEVSQRRSRFLSEKSCDMLLKFAMEPSCRYSKGKTFLHIAVEVANESAVRTLLRREFEVGARDENGQTALHYAIIRERDDVVKCLVSDSKADPSAKDSSDATPLTLAIERNLIRYTKLLWSKLEPKPIDKIDGSGKTLLHLAGGKETAEFLVKETIDPWVTDSGGKTALHLAIDRGTKDVALYLLELDNVPKEPLDISRRESPLVTACRRGLSTIVPKILHRWPDLLNKVDTEYGQSPLSWACDIEHDDIVEHLVAYERIKINLPAEGWQKLTPLHIAVRASSTKNLACLLQQPSTQLHLKSEDGDTALRRAVDYRRPEAASMLLLDYRTPLEERIEYAKEFASSSDDTFHGIIPYILESVIDTYLIQEYFSWLTSHMATRDMPTPIARFIEDLKRGKWRHLQAPYHVAIILGDAEFVETLNVDGASQEGLDEDNWSSMDYARRFKHGGDFTDLLNHLQPINEQKHKEPSAFDWTFQTDYIRLAPCTAEGHDHCSKVHEIEVTGESNDKKRACLRTAHSLPPSAEYFYFEVEVLLDSDSRSFGLGFCGLNQSDNKMPGWLKGSWGYHGDDGKLFMESGTGAIPSTDFGDLGVFGSGDVVGVCLNMNTGQGFCTRNGQKLDMGVAFTERKDRFRYGKMYPCVGFSVAENGIGLRFRVNFDGTERHPFKYKGPFDFD